MSTCFPLCYASHCHVCLFLLCGREGTDGWHLTKNKQPFRAYICTCLHDVVQPNDMNIVAFFIPPPFTLIQIGIGKKHKTPQQRNAAIGLGNGLMMLGYGAVSGVYDFFSLPVRRAKKADSTTLGALAGFGQGTLSLLFKPMAGICYLAYCPYDGIKNSVRNAGIPVVTVYYPKQRLSA